MINYSFLFEIGLIVSCATVFGYVARYLRQPPIAAYMLAGLLLGPLGFSVISGRPEILALSELGIAFLLFGAAIDINLNKLRGVGVVSFAMTILQLSLTFIFSYYTALFFNLPTQEAIYVGVVLAFSSTMIVIKLLSDERQLDTLHGRLIIATLVLQDLVIIMLMPILDLMGQTVPLEVVAGLVFKGLGLFCIAVVLNRFVFPRVLHFVSKSSELLYLTSLTLCFSFMGLAHMLGFSLAIGAFVAGIALSTFYYGPEIAGRIASLKDFFATIFFVTLGLQITTLVGWELFPMLLSFIALAIIIKPIFTSLLTLLFGYGGRTSLAVGTLLGNVSEFSFIIASIGVTSGKISSPVFSSLVVVIIVSMVATPYFAKYQHGLFSLLSRATQVVPLNLLHFFRRRTPEKTLACTVLKNHTIIVGCDRMGEQVLGAVKHPLVVDYNPDVIDNLTARNISCIYGDAENTHVQNLMCLKKADVLVVAIPDVEATENLLINARRANKKMVIFARANTVQDALVYYSMGADLVLLPELIAGTQAAGFLKKYAKSRKSVKKLRIDHLNFLEKTVRQRGYLPRSQAKTEHRQ